MEEEIEMIAHADLCVEKKVDGKVSDSFHKGILRNERFKYDFMVSNTKQGE
jgi:hypothetical protein